MPLEQGYNPSGYDLQSATITPHGSSEPFDITNIIVKIEISQSIDKISFSGHIEVLDNVGLLENLPIRGEEILDLEIQTLDIKTKIKQKLFVYSVSDITIESDGRSAFYRLNFISALSFKSGTQVVVEAFSSKPEDIVKKIFQDRFSKVKGEAETLSFETKRYPIVDDRDRNLWIQPGSTGKLECIIPRYLPGKAMNFVAMRTFNSNTPSQFFRFFETLEGYYFVTDEFLASEGAEEPFSMFYTPASGNLDPRNPAQQLNRIESLHVLNRGSHTGSSMYNGSYASRVKEIDLLRRKVTNRDFLYTRDANYVDGSGDKAKKSQAPHSAEFIDETFNLDVGKQVLVIKDYASENDNEGQLRGEQFFPEIISNRLSYMNHANGILIGAHLKGRADIMPGKVIDLSIANVDASEEVKMNAQLAGRYLVRNTTHTFDKGVLHTFITLGKYDWSK